MITSSDAGFTPVHDGIFVERAGPAGRMSVVQYSNQVSNHQLQLERSICPHLHSCLCVCGTGTEPIYDVSDNTHRCARQHEWVSYNPPASHRIPHANPLTHIFRRRGWRRAGIYAANSAQKPVHNTVAVIGRLSDGRPKRTVVIAHQMQALSLICYRYVRTPLSWQSVHGGRTSVGCLSHASQAATKNI